MKENWAKNKKLPPIYIEVLDRKTLGKTKTEEIVFAQGSMPHLGYPYKGWSGPETLIFRRKRTTGEWQIVKKEIFEYKKAITQSAHYNFLQQ